MKTISVEEAKARLEELIQSAVSGEIVIIGDDYHSVQLLPIHLERKPRIFGSGKGSIRIRDDFDEQKH